MKTYFFVIMLIAMLILTACQPASTPIVTMGGASKSDSYDSVQSAPRVLVASESKDGTTTENRIVIKNASLNIVVDDPEKTMDTIRQMAQQMGGFVVSSNVSKRTTDRGDIPQANITVRIPAAKLDDTLAQIKGLVKNIKEDILSENVSGQDVTREYTDLQSRLSNYERAEKQLQSILDKATKTEDVLSVLTQLNQVREQIEVAKGQIKYYDESSQMSAVSVILTASASIVPLKIGGWQPVGVARDAIQTFIDALKILATVVIWLILFAIPIALIIYFPVRLIWLGIRKLRARNKKNRPTPPPTAS